MDVTLCSLFFSVCASGSELGMSDVVTAIARVERVGCLDYEPYFVVDARWTAFHQVS